MNTQTTTIALLPRTARRNRVLLAAIVGGLSLSIGWATGMFDRERFASPLLVSMDELAVPAARSEVNERPGKSMTALFSSLISPVDFTPMPPANMAAAEPMSITEAANAADRAEKRIEPSTLQPSVQMTYEVDDSMRWYNGRPVRPVRTMWMTVTAYSPDERSCGASADGITASGYSVWTNGMKMAAADTSVLPFGSLITVPGYDSGEVVPVLDRGGAIKGNRLDMLYPTHEQALKWGTQRLEITVWEYADGKPHDFKARYNSASSVKN